MEEKYRREKKEAVVTAVVQQDVKPMMEKRNVRGKGTNCLAASQEEVMNGLNSLFLPSALFSPLPPPLCVRVEAAKKGERLFRLRLFTYAWRPQKKERDFSASASLCRRIGTVKGTLPPPLHFVYKKKADTKGKLKNPNTVQMYHNRVHLPLLRCHPCHRNPPRGTTVAWGTRSRNYPQAASNSNFFTTFTSVLSFCFLFIFFFFLSTFAAAECCV